MRADERVSQPARSSVVQPFRLVDLSEVQAAEIACKRFDGSRQVPHINLGKLYCARNDLDQALTHLDEALRLDPGNPEVRELASRIRSQLS